MPSSPFILSPMADLSSYTNPPAQRSDSSGCTVLLLALLAVVIAIGVLVGLVVWVFVPLVQEQRELRNQPGLGKPLPQLQLVGLTGGAQPVALADLQGKVALVNFWGTWCPPCRDELPHIAAIYDNYRHHDDVRILAVSCGRGLEDLPDLRAATAAFLDLKCLDLPTYADPEQITRNAVDDIGRFSGYPTTLLLDRQGVVRAIWIGYEPGVENEMVRQLEKVLGERP